MSDWITARETVHRAKDAGVTEGDLIEWAEAGRLRSRADRGRFSSDEEGEERLLKLPDTDPERQEEIKKRALLGEPWPDIPRDFWYWMNADSAQSKAHWASGAFATTVHYDNAPYHHQDSQHIKLLDVTFHAGDLAGLLRAPGASSLRGTLPKNAKPNDHLYEEQAHRAAEFVRREKIKRSEAFRRALEDIPVPPKGDVASRERAVRGAYDRMYNPQGLPIQNDPN